MTSTKNMRWKTISEWIDQETGEVLKKNSVQSGRYELIKTSKYIQTDGNIREKIYINECKRSNQKRLWE
jgi:hypothetical protein